MSDSTKDLLVEIGTEELPPKALLNLAHAFRDSMERQFQTAGVETALVDYFATPRRLALLTRAVAERQRDTESIRRGPAVAAAFGPDGAPTKAALGFARSCGTTVEQLERDRNDKGEWLCYRKKETGKETRSLVPEMVERALADLPIPKKMRWGSGEAEFVRPVHWVCIVFGDQIVPGRVLGVEISGETHGHRFHHPETISISEAGDYPRLLRDLGKVEASFERRRETIEHGLRALSESEGVVAQVDRYLLDEVTALVEWPVPIMGCFDEAFLSVPPEVLIETMQRHQKYFPARDTKGALVARFIAVANIESREPVAVRSGNERVIRPRFSDAKFFWEQDLKTPLIDQFSRLDSIVYQEHLGSVADKCRRVEDLAVGFAERLGLDGKSVARAAHLSKCDLVTAMVGEFPSLQGTMGRYYASHEGEDETVARALEEQYWPRFAGDDIPTSDCGRLLAVADRIDTLVGIFGIGLRPTGAKDPYGLRRASISVMRILIESSLPLNLRDAVRLASSLFPQGVIPVSAESEVYDYMVERLVGYYQEQDVSPDTVESVVAIGETTPLFLDQRIRAVDAFRSLPDAVSLAAANKRIRNILAKSANVISDTQEASGQQVNVGLFSEPAEHALWNRMLAVENDVAALLEQRDFAKVLAHLATLRSTVDGYFEDVMVNVEEHRIKANRLAVLSRLMSMFLDVADISKLH